MSVAAASVHDTRNQFQHLFDIYWPIGVGVFVVVGGLCVFMAVRYRSKERSWATTPTHHPLEEAYAVGIGCVVAALLFFTYRTMDRLPVDQDGDGKPGEVVAGAERVNVIGARWHWRFDYPKYGVTVGGDHPTLVVPSNTPISFQETSLDVVHSFWIPERRFKMDAFPGRKSTFTLTFPNLGFQRDGGECNQYCGLLHSYMTFNVDVVTPERYRAWIQERQGAAR